MERTNTFTNLFKILLAALVIYLIYRYIVRKKVDFNNLPIIGDLKKKLENLN